MPTTSKKAIEEQAAKVGAKVSFLEFATYPEIKTALVAGRVDYYSLSVLARWQQLKMIHQSY